MNGWYIVNPVSSKPGKGKPIQKTFILFFYLALLPGLGLAECSKENREKAVSSGIDPKVVKILCGDSLEEDYVFEVKPPQKKKNHIRNQKTTYEVEDSQTPVLNSLALPLKFPEGPPTCEQEKVARMIARGFSDRLIRSICGEGVIPEKPEKDLGIPRHGYACLDSTLYNPLKDEICLQSKSGN